MMISNGIRLQNSKSWITKQSLSVSFSNLHWEPNQNLLFIQMEITSDGRRPQNIKYEISQHPLSVSSSNFKFKI